MISNKTAVVLLFITSSINTVASSSSSGTQGSGPSSGLTIKKRQGPTPKPREVLRDVDSVVVPVGVRGGGIKGVEVLQGCAPNTKKAAPAVKDAVNTTNDVLPGSEQIMTRVSVCQRLFSWTAASIAKRVKLLIGEGKYWAAICLAIAINRDDFLVLTCSIIKTFEQYKGLINYLKLRNLVTSFYVYGNIGVVKGAIIESRVYVSNDYVKDGDLEKALLQALEKDRYDRFIELLKVRKDVTAEKDRQPKREGRLTSFEKFAFYFLKNLAPWEDGMTLRRFLILRGDELRNKYRHILDTLCLYLVLHLSSTLLWPKAERLLVGLIGQPSLLTPVAFARGFLCYNNDKNRSTFIMYGWREAVQEGLKTECYGGGEYLWRVMQEEKPEQYPGEFPETEEARAAVCVHFLTKKQKEEQWADKNDEIFYNEFKNHESIFYLLPDVLWAIIFGYVISRPDTDDPIVS